MPLEAILLAALSSPLPPAQPLRYSTLSGQKPLVIAHRGASAYRPEHTLASYRLAMEMGADFIEPDLVSTRDGVLVARHEPNIIETTDVSKRPEFQARRRELAVDGKLQLGFFVQDFTLAELKTLRAIQSRPFRDQSYNGLYEIPTFSEIIGLVKDYERETGRKVGIYPETKHPTFFRDLNLPLEEKMVATLLAEGFSDPQRIYIQSFEVSNLKDILVPLMARAGVSWPLIQLTESLSAQPYDYQRQGKKETYGDLLTPESLKNFVASYARGIGPAKTSFILRKAVEPVDLNGDGVAEAKESLTGTVIPLVAAAHEAGLLVHPYTLRSEEMFQAVQFKTPLDEYAALIALGVDGFFTDFPDTGRLSLP